MYSVIKKITLICYVFTCAILCAQNTNSNSLEIGGITSGSETLFYGGYAKYNIPLSKNKHHFTLAINLVAYFDFKGESEPEAYLKNDIDMRLLPSINFGYSLNFNKFQLNFEAPVGLNFATTKGTLVNKKIGFERDFNNKETFFNYGVSFSPKYKINKSNSIGLYTFLPLIDDKAQSGYQMGINWTKNFTSKK